MSPTIMPWPMTLAPTNDALRHENHAEKTLIQKKLTIMIREFIEDARIVLLSKKHKIFVRVGERGIELMVLT
jgi:hypothetical protein